ncbi:MAG: prepilin-type N-terminal cleavage/methylation domain-containing protein [Proteobacteria bacterium]|nr:prepilin-type N-terminal cleavage/methylation domain-containing protein [Pseudomonadota bacterium]
MGELNRKMNRKRGFTIIELMVALTIVSILAAIAYPIYTTFTTRSNRALALTEITRIAQLQERFYMDNRTYGTLTGLGFAANTIGLDAQGDAVAAGTGFYNVTVTPAPSATQFTIQAVATNNQTSDTGCTSLTMTNAGATAPDACW